MLLNLIIPIISFAAVSLMGIVITPFFIKNFGYEGLGLISNSNALIQSLFFAGGAFTTVYARLYSKSESNEERKRILSDLNQILTFLGIIAIFICVLFFVFFKIKGGEAFEYYSLTFFSASIIIISQSFSVFPFSENKVYVNSLIDCLRTLLRNVLCIGMFFLSVNSVLVNGWAMVISSFIMMLVLSVLYKSNKIISFGKITFNTNLKNSLWVCLNQGGAYLFSYSDIFFVNFILGHYVGGVYALLIQIPTLLKAISVVAIGSISSFTVKFNSKFSADNAITLKVINKNILFFNFFISIVFAMVSAYKDLIFSIWIPAGVDSMVLYNFNNVCVIMMILSITSIINIFLAGWGFFSFPAKITIISAATSGVVMLFLYGLKVELSILMIFSVVYCCLILKNCVCFIYFYLSTGLGVKNLARVVSLCCFVIVINFFFVRVVRYFISNEYLSLSLTLMVILLVSIPLFYSFKSLREYV